MLRSRSFIGCAVGVVLGLLGPIMGAVASHSGSTPESSVAQGSADVRRGAWARWSVKSGTTTTTYVFALWSDDYAEARAGHASQEAGRGQKGQAFAQVRTCGTTCRTRTYRGASGAEATAVALPGSNANGFQQAPALDRATFDGVLPGTARSCRFTVTWTGRGDLQHRTGRDADAGPLYAQARADGDVWRWATATLTSDCWPALDAGEGQIWRNGALGVDV